METKNEVAEKKEVQGHSERFLATVQKNLAEVMGMKEELPDLQKQLIKRTFVKIDAQLKEMEIKRSGNPSKKNDTPIKWQNINMEQLAMDVMATTLLNLDPYIKNHINFVPYPNKHTGKIDLTPIMGFVGMQYVAETFGEQDLLFVNTQLVYSTDTYKPVKRSGNNPVEHVIFEINNPFNRGEVIGGFAEFVYSNPIKNKVLDLSLADILKRKPKHGGIEFWGGEKDEWVNGQKTGKKEKVEGWYNEMLDKTLRRWAFGKVQLDPLRVNGVVPIVSTFIEREYSMPTEDVKTQIIDQHRDSKQEIKTIEITATQVEEAGF